jgi:7,8-dihydropterin-6-yl-methyl-4-(beta-D-ribofuranosyl)aminobenzene 5'-phosphate synthase
MNKKVSIQASVVYDNNPFDKKLKTDWGFSCLLKGLDKTILFDTGTNGSLLLENMEKLEIQPDDVDLVFLSHFHRDHFGGLDALLRKNPRIAVWLPKFFPSNFKESLKNKRTILKEVEGFQEICESAYTTGVIPGWIKEQSLVLDVDQGLILVTGCAHPRITNIIAKSKDLLKKDVFMVFGGFHLAGFNEAEIMEIIETFRGFGVKKVGPCHCSGEDARRLFAREYGKDFIRLGAGKKVRM